MDRVRKSQLGSALFFGAVTLLALGATALAAYETWALEFGHTPITYKVRDSERRHPSIWHGAMFAAGVLAGHLFWCDHLPWDKRTGGCR